MKVPWHRARISSTQLLGLVTHRGKCVKNLLVSSSAWSNRCNSSANTAREKLANATGGGHRRRRGQWKIVLIRAGARRSLRRGSAGLLSTLRAAITRLLRERGWNLSATDGREGGAEKLARVHRSGKRISGSERVPDVGPMAIYYFSSIFPVTSSSFFSHSHLCLFLSLCESATQETLASTRKASRDKDG